jgi:hypothetical protein
MGVGPVSNSSWAFKHREIDVEKNKLDMPKNVNDAPAEKQVAPPPSGEDRQGVIRLLQEGHFKGVADIRLRINFHEELTGMENAAKSDIVGAEVSTFEGGVSEVINRILLLFSGTESEGNEDGATDSAAVTEALDAFANTRGSFSEDILEDLDARFNALVASINDLIVPPSEVPDADEQPPVELPENIIVPADEEVTGPPVVSDSDEGSPLEPPDIVEETAVEPTSIWAALVQKLESSYQSFRTELDGKTASYRILPNLSPPSGQGKAYDKFLAIYRALTEESQNTDVQTDNIELLV